MTAPSDPLSPAKDEVRMGYSSMGNSNSASVLPPVMKHRRQSLHLYFWQSRGPPRIVTVVLLLAMSFGATVGIIPSMMTERFAEQRYDYTGDQCNSFAEYSEKPEECISASADSQTAAAVSELIANTLTLITSAMMGSISDMHGRRGILILGILVASLSPLSLLYMAFQPTASPLIYYSARSIHGLVNWMAIALSAMADCLPPHMRAAGVGIYMAGFWGGLCIAPSFVLFLGHTNVIILSCILQFAGLATTICFFPETLSNSAAEEARQRRKLNSDSRGVIGRLLWNLSLPFRELSIVARDGFFQLLSALAFFNGMVTAGDKTLLLYYVDNRLSFGAKDVAIMFLVVGFSSVIAQGLILKPLNDCIGERYIVIICFFASTIANVAYGLATNKETLYAGVCLGAFTGMAFPTIAAIKANNVDESEQGRIQGALYSIQAIAAGVGPAMMRYVDHRGKDTFFGPGSMFFFAAMIQSFAFYCALKLPSDKSNSRNYENDANELADLTINSS